MKEIIKLENARSYTSDAERMQAVLQKWRRIVQLLEDGYSVGNYGAGSCAFCVEYNGSNCVGCPIKEQSGFDSCENTPWGDFRVSESVKNARRFLEYLENIHREMHEEAKQVKQQSLVLEKADKGMFNTYQDEVGYLRFSTPNNDAVKFKEMLKELITGGRIVITKGETGETVEQPEAEQMIMVNTLDGGAVFLKIGKDSGEAHNHVEVYSETKKYLGYYHFQRNGEVGYFWEVAKQ